MTAPLPAPCPLPSALRPLPFASRLLLCHPERSRRISNYLPLHLVPIRIRIPNPLIADSRVPGSTYAHTHDRARARLPILHRARRSLLRGR